MVHSFQDEPNEWRILSQNQGDIQEKVSHLTFCNPSGLNTQNFKMNEKESIMKRTKVKTALLLTLTLALALPMFAQPKHGSPKNRAGQQAMLTKLDLTAEQEQQMQDLRFAQAKRSIDLRAELQQEHLKLRQLRQADEPNKKKLYAQVEKVGAVEIKLDKARIDHMLKVQKVLTADQFKAFRSQMQHHPGPCDGQRGSKGDRLNKHFRHDRF
jgi:Spy/CpxP family protein refolding chaperone